MQPCFVNTAIPSVHDCWPTNNETLIQLPVADCARKYKSRWTGESISGVPQYEEKAIVCKLPACAVRAFKELQTQQLAHVTSIAQLETAVIQLQTPPPPPINPLKESTSDQHAGSESIQEEVLKWLGGCRE